MLTILSKEKDDKVLVRDSKGNEQLVSSTYITELSLSVRHSINHSINHVIMYMNACPNILTSYFCMHFKL